MTPRSSLTGGRTPLTPEDLTVVIPSRHRAKACARVVRMWPKVIVCVDAAEADDYGDVGAELLLHPPVYGMGELRQWVLDHVPSRVVVQCDDDVQKVHTMVGMRYRRVEDPHSLFLVVFNAAVNAHDAGCGLFTFGTSADLRHVNRSTRSA